MDQARVPVTLSYRFTVDPAEALRANRLLDGGRPLGWANWLVWPMLLGLLFLYRSKGLAWSEMGFLWFAIALLTLIQLAAQLLQRRTARREYDSNPALRAEQRFTLSEDGISIAGGPGHFELRWEGIRGIRETNEFVLFHVGKHTGAFLPKRAVGSEQPMAELRDFLDAVARPRLSATRTGAAT